MTKSFVAFLVALGLLAGLGIGYVAFHQQNFGATTVGYQASQGSIGLFNALSSELQDISNVRASLAGFLTLSTTTQVGNAVTLPPIGVLNNTSTASSSFTLTGAAVGDYCLAGVTTSTINIQVTCQITAANTGILYFTNLSVNTTTMSTSTVKIIDLPVATFVAPPSLLTSTSTSQG